MPALLEGSARCRQPQAPPHLRALRRRLGLGFQPLPGPTVQPGKAGE